RLARADIAVEEPQHAVRLRKVSADVADRTVLRWRQCVGQGGNDVRAQASLARTAAPGPAAHVTAQQSECELAGKQFVIGEPRPCLALRFKIHWLRGTMNLAERLREIREILLREPRRV